MSPTQKKRAAIDLLLVVLLPVLMAELLTGQLLHEWLGSLMSVVLIVHHLLNHSWYKGIFRANKSLYQIAGIALDLLLLVDVLALGASGVVMSGYVFSWLPIYGGAVWARRIHLLSSYWGLLLMSLHTGMHWEMVMAAARRRFAAACGARQSRSIARGAAAVIALFGIFCFVDQRLPDYLFLQTAFVFWDESKDAAWYFIQILGVMGLFIVLGHFVAKLLRRQSRRKTTQSN